MFEDQRRGPEDAPARSARHRRLIIDATLFFLALVFLLFGAIALANWLTFGDMRLNDLRDGILLTLVIGGIGMAFEVRKRW